MTPRLAIPELVVRLRQRYALRWQGIHGAPHWARVRWNGLALAERTGANRTVVELFAMVHDVCRSNDHHDPQHGARAARVRARTARLGDLDLGHGSRTARLRLHAPQRRLYRGGCDGQTCWDADRLDLGRVGSASPALSLHCCCQGALAAGNSLSDAACWRVASHGSAAAFDLVFDLLLAGFGHTGLPRSP